MTEGIPVEAADFFAELEYNNERGWWLANQLRWRTVVREPFEALCEALAAEFGQPKVFRPNRDVRFSADKSPYKTHQGGVVRTSPGVGLYLQVSASGLLTGTGWWSPEPGQLEAFREAVLDDDGGAALVAIVEELEAGGSEIHGDRLKTAPRGIDPSHPRIGLLRHRTLLASREHGTPEWLETPEVVERVRDDWRRYAALNRWLAAHLVAQP
jgi:uncharacterized protein (TIGR02453 family)